MFFSYKKYLENISFYYQDMFVRYKKFGIYYEKMLEL